MNLALILDANALSNLIAPAKHRNFAEWFERMRRVGHVFVIPEIADYELRRELIRIKSTLLPRLDELAELDGFYYAPLSTPVMRLAADLWAEAWNERRATADRHALDGDATMGATARLLKMGERGVVVVTDNLKHIQRYTSAARWEDIEP